MAIAGDNSTAALQLDQENARLRDDKRVDLVYGTIVTDEFEIRVEKVWVPIWQNIAQKLQRFALVSVSRLGELFPATGR